MDRILLSAVIRRSALLQSSDIQLLQEVLGRIVTQNGKESAIITLELVILTHHWNWRQNKYCVIWVDFLYWIKIRNKLYKT